MNGTKGKTTRFWFCILLCLVAGSTGAPAASLKKARVTQIIKDVKLVAGQAVRPATVSDEVAEGAAVRTGSESRAELTFTDLTITRLGANTIFSFNEGARQIDLGSGAILVSVPRDGASVKVSTAAVTAAITGGTALMEANKGLPTKIYVLEGSGQVCSKTNPNECQTAAGGEMIMVTPDGHIMPPVKFNAGLLYKTSALIADFPLLPNADLIAAVIAEQQISFANQWSPSGQANGSNGTAYSNLVNTIYQSVAASTGANFTATSPPTFVTATFTGAATGNWSDPASWNPAVVPNNGNGQTFDAAMSSGTLTQDIVGGVTIQQFTMNGGTLFLTNPLTLNTGLQYNGGTINNGTLSIFGTSNQSAPFTINNINISNGGTYNINFDASSVFVGLGSFDNNGTLKKTTGSGTDIFNNALNNSGTVTSQSGTLNISGGGTSNGTFTAAFGAIVEFGNNYVFTNGSRFAGTGQIQFDAGTLMSFAGSITNDAQILASSDILINSPVTLTGTGALTLFGPARVLGAGSLTNASTINGDTASGGSLGADQLGIVNKAGGLIDANVAGQSLDVDPGSSGLSNQGILRASNGGLLFVNGNNSGIFNNGGGTITALNGSEVQLRNGAVINGGTLSTSGTGLIRNFSGASLISLTNSGKFVADDGTTTTLTGTITNSGSIDLNSTGSFTDLVLNGDVTLNGGGTINLTTSARVLGSGTLINVNNTIQGETKNLGSLGFDQIGIINQAGGVIDANVSGFALDVDPSASGGLANAGIMRASNGGILVLNGNGGGAFSNSGTIEAITGGALQFTGGVTSNGTVDLNNNTLNVTGTYTQTAGTFKMRGGTVTSTSTLDFQGGLIDAHGTINGNISNAATLLPALGGNGLNVNGNLTLLGSSQLSFQLGGLTQGSQYSSLNVNGTVALSGNLVISFANGFQNSVSKSDSFTLLTSTSNFSGSFGNVLSGTRLLTSDQSGSFLVSYSGNTLVLSNFTSGSSLITTVVFNGAANGLWSDATVWNPMIVPNNNGANLFNAQMNSGMLTQDLAGGVTIENFSMSGGTLVLNNPLTLNAGLTYDGGTINGGALTIAGTSTQSAAMTASGLTISNSGYYQLTFDNSNAFVGSVTFNNSGTVVKTAASGPGTITFNAALNNAGGSMSSQSGTLRFAGGGALSGTFFADVGAQIQFSNNFSFGTGAGFIGGGTILFDNGTSTSMSGAITNSGNLLFNSTGSYTDLALGGDLTLSGGGTITLQNADRILGSGILTNVDNTILGETSNSGGLGYDQIGIVNQSGGVIDANVSGFALNVDPSAANGLINQGVMRASNGGILLLNGYNGGGFNNTGGTITALDASQVQLTNGANISGGILTTVGSGGIYNISTATLTSLTNAGNFIGNNGTSTFLVGTITNTGNILLNSIGSYTDLVVNGNVTLTGSGTLSLQNAARVLGSGVLLNASTIRGETSNSGSLGYDQIGIVNQATGLIEANVSGLALNVDPNAGNGLTNNGTMQASNGGILLLNGYNGGVFTNNNVIRALDGSQVQLTNGAVVSGGTFTTAGSGVIRNISSATLDSLTNAGSFIANNGTTTTLTGTITNIGSILLDSTGSYTDLFINGNVSLNGSGTLTLRNADRVLGNGVLTNNSTIQGETSNSGALGYDQIGIVNSTNGLIDANVSGLALNVDPNAANGLVNNGLMRASNGGILLLNGYNGGTFTNNNIISALNGSEVQLTNGANVIGGTFTTAGSGVIRNVSTATLTSLTNAGSFIGNNGTSTFLSGSLTNNGTILLNSTGSYTDLVLQGDVTLTGSGTLILQNADRVLGNGILTNASNIVGETNNSGGLGFDQIGIVNSGTGIIDANVSGLALNVDPNAANGLVNNGIMRASNGGILLLNGYNGGTFTNNATITALNGSEVQLTNGANVIGGTFNTVGTGVIRNVATATLTSLTNAGSFIGNNGTSTFLSGAITNNGTILLNSTGSYTDLVLQGDVTLTGSGTLILQNADRVLGNGILTNASNIVGETNNSGGLGFDQIGIVNQATGIIDANVSGLALNVDPNAANGLVNNGIMRATNGGILLLNGYNGGVFNNNATITAGNGSEVQLTNGANVVGGTFTTVGSGVVRNINQATLTSLTNAGSFIANNGTSTFLSGTITNNGSILINSTGSYTDLVVNGNVTLTGAGTLTLQNADRVLGSGILTNASTIQGETSNSGGLGYDQIGIVNQNLIDANVSGLTLVVDPSAASGFVNDGGLLRASNGGILLLSGYNGGTFSNINFAGLQAINGGIINLTGTLTSTAGSQLTLNNGTFLDNGSADVYQVNGTAGTITVANNATFAAPGGFHFDGVNSSAGGTLNFTAPLATFGIGAGEIGGASFNGGDAATSSSPGGDGGTLNVTATTGDIAVSGVTIEASTGANGASVNTGGAGGTVNLTANVGAVNVNDRIQVSHNNGNRKSAKGGNINITSGKTSGVAINIGNSGQLLSLLNAAAPGPGGKIIISASAPASSSIINVSGTIQADRGAIDIRNSGDNGVINLSSATLSADVLKCAVLGPTGVLNIGGGTLSADSVLKLYATGSNGTINFIADVSLNGNSTKIIAADTVKIFDNVTVTINGPSAASVYTNHAKYSATFGGDGSTTGTFAGKGATLPQPFDSNTPPLGPVGGP